MIELAHVPSRRRKEARPQELLDAALALFVEKGFASTRTSEIAARAGVSKGTLYLYFASKEDLLKSLIAERFASVVPGVSQDAAVDGRTSPDMLWDVLAGWQSALMEGHASAIVKLVFAESQRFPSLAQSWSSQVIEPLRAALSRIVARGIERGEFRRVDADLVVHSLVLPIVAVSLLGCALGPGLSGAPREASELVSQHFRLVLGGLIGGPSRPAGPTYIAW